MNLHSSPRRFSPIKEVRALRDTFGASTEKLVVANTKGFTGHPMGVGIEDASMFYGLKKPEEFLQLPIIKKDPELGNLKLSKGGEYPQLEYGLRFAAGFGSHKRSLFGSKSGPLLVTG